MSKHNNNLGNADFSGKMFNNALINTSSINFNMSFEGVDFYTNTFYNKLVLELDTKQIQFTFEELNRYVRTLIVRRINYVTTGQNKPTEVGQVFIPSFVEHILSYIGSGFNTDYGMRYSWNKIHFEDPKHEMTVEQVKRFSMMLSLYSKFTHDIVPYMDNSITGNSNCLVIVDQETAQVLVPMNMPEKSIMIASVIGQHYGSDDDKKEYHQCFRFIVGDQESLIYSNLQGVV